MLSKSAKRVKEKLIKQESSLNYNIKMKGRTLDFLNKIEDQGGYIGYVDSMELVHHYLLHFPPIFDLSTFSTQDELVICYGRLKKLLQYNLDHDPKEYYTFDKDSERKKEINRERAREYNKKRKDVVKKQRENETPEQKEKRLKRLRENSRIRRAMAKNEQDTLF